jgi:hypothetical protein
LQAEVYSIYDEVYYQKRMLNFKVNCDGHRNEINGCQRKYEFYHQASNIISFSNFECQKMLAFVYKKIYKKKKMARIFR